MSLKKEYKYLILASLGVFILWGATWLLLLLENTVRGPIGDMFGSVNALFSGLAFAGLIYTILLQKNELRLQRQELSATRVEFKTQNETLKKQQFENTFFNLLNLHHNIVNSIDLTLSETQILGHLDATGVSKNAAEKIAATGRDSFIKFTRKLKHDFSANNNKVKQSEFDQVNSIYKMFYEQYQSDLGHYFRNLYHIFKFVDNSEVTDKERYTSLVRAQLSDDELMLLFYNSLSDLGREKFKPLIEKYHLLKNLNRSSLIKDSHFVFYSKSAFE